MTRKWQWLGALVLVVVLISTLVIMNPVLAGKAAPQPAAAQLRQQAADINTDVNNPGLMAGNYDVFLEIDGIDGESKDEDHKDWIEVVSLKWGMSQPTLAGGLRPGMADGRAQVQNLSFTHFLDKASPKLMTACVKGTHIKKATLELRARGAVGEGFYELKLSDVVVSAVDLAGMSYASPVGDVSQVSALALNRPAEEVMLSFGGIEWTYNVVSEKGDIIDQVAGGYDIIANKAK